MHVSACHGSLCDIPSCGALTCERVTESVPVTPTTVVMPAFSSCDSFASGALDANPAREPTDTVPHVVWQQEERWSGSNNHVRVLPAFSSCDKLSLRRPGSETCNKIPSQCDGLAAKPKSSWSEAGLEQLQQLGLHRPGGKPCRQTFIAMYHEQLPSNTSQLKASSSVVLQQSHALHMSTCSCS